VLVDVRESTDRAEGFPAGSRPVPLDELRARLGELPPDMPIAFVCRSGRRSEMVADLAWEAGLEASSVSGGMEAWRTAGLETDRSGA